MTAQEKEKAIAEYMQKLDLNRQEAEQLWEDDNSDEMLPEVAEMTEKAKQCKMYVRGDKKRKTAKKERKIDNTKKYLLELFQSALPANAENVNIKNEVELNFYFEGESYAVKLIKHRPPKK